ncbi:hypothetical protein ES703_17889 [subsurface metagenome]
MELAVILPVQKAPASALLAAQGVISLQQKKLT